MNMYTALTHTFMYAEALVRRLPVPGTWADPYTFNFSEKTVKQPQCGVL